MNEILNATVEATLARPTPYQIDRGATHEIRIRILEGCGHALGRAIKRAHSVAKKAAQPLGINPINLRRWQERLILDGVSYADASRIRNAIDADFERRPVKLGDQTKPKWVVVYESDEEPTVTFQYDVAAFTAEKALKVASRYHAKHQEHAVPTEERTLRHCIERIEQAERTGEPQWGVPADLVVKNAKTQIESIDRRLRAWAGTWNLKRIDLLRGAERVQREEG